MPGLAHVRVFGGAREVEEAGYQADGGDYCEESDLGRSLNA